MIRRKPKPIRWLTAARDDLAEVIDYIARDNPDAAQRLLDRILTKVETLSETPDLGTRSPYHRTARQLIHGNYLVYYTVHRTEIVIRAVVHGARRFRSEWLRRED